MRDRPAKAVRTGCLLGISGILALGSGCHGQTPSSKEGTVETRLSGMAFLSAPLSARRMEIRDEEKASPSAIAIGQTDERGLWSVKLGPTFGTFRAEVVLDDGPNGRRTTAIVDDVKLGAGREGVAITPVTHLTAIYAHALERRGISPKTALKEARRLLHEHFGGVDHATTLPSEVTRAASPALDDGTRVTILLRGLEEEASLLAARSPALADGDVSAAALVERLAEDLEDGVFDGQGPRGRVSFAGAALDPDSLRTTYANAIEHFLLSARNTSRYRPADLKPVLDVIRTNQSALFPRGSGASGSAAVIRADFLRTDLSRIPKDRPLRGSVYLDVHVEDRSAVDRIEVATTSTTSAVGPSLFGRGAEARFPVDTRRMPEGENVLRVVATNVQNVGTSTSIRFLVDNTPPVLSLRAPAEVTTATVTVSGTWTDVTGPVDVVLTAEGPPVRLRNVPPAFSFVIAIPCGRDVIIRGVAEDAAENQSAPAFVRTHCFTDRLAIHLGLSSVIDERDLIVERRGEHLAFNVPAVARSATISDAAVQSRLQLAKYFTRLDPDSENLPVLRLVVTGSVSDLAYRYLVNGRELRPWRPVPVNTNGEGVLPLSYETLGLDGILGPVGRVHRVELRARDRFGHERERAIEFDLAILSPPVWVDGCGPDRSIAWGQLGPRFRAGQDIAVGQGELRYLLDVASTSLAPRDGLVLEMLPVLAGAEVTELSEQKFFAPMFRQWDVWTEGIPPNVRCNFNIATMGSVTTDEWSGMERCGVGQYYPNDQVFYRPGRDGRIFEVSRTPSRIEVYDGSHFLGSGAEMLGTAPIRADRLLTFRASMTRPTLWRGAIAYDWSSTYDPVPAGYMASVNTAGRYRIPAPYRHTGLDVLIASFTAGEIQVRAFTTRAALHSLRLTNDPPAFRARHDRFPGVVVPVVTSTRCQQPIIEEVSE